MQEVEASDISPYFDPTWEIEHWFREKSGCLVVTCQPVFSHLLELSERGTAVISCVAPGMAGLGGRSLSLCVLYIKKGVRSPFSLIHPKHQCNRSYRPQAFLHHQSVEPHMNQSRAVNLLLLYPSNTSEPIHRVSDTSSEQL